MDGHTRQRIVETRGLETGPTTKEMLRMICTQCGDQYDVAGPLPFCGSECYDEYLEENQPLETLVERRRAVRRTLGFGTILSEKTRQELVELEASLTKEIEEVNK